MSSIRLAIRRIPQPVWILTLIVLIGVGIRIAIAAHGWFYWDDITLQSKARDKSLTELLFQDHDGHLMPAAWFIQWLLAHYAPLKWTAAMAVLVILHVGAASAVAWVSWVFCRRIFVLQGVRIPWAALPLSIYLLSPLTLPATTWLAAAVNALPMHMAMAMVVGHGWLLMRAGALSTPRKTDRHLLAIVGWFFIGLLFNERSLFIAPLAIALLVCFAAAAGWLRHCGRKIIQISAVLVIISALWTAVYLLTVGFPTTLSSDSDESGSLLALPTLIIRGYARALLPTAAGGPWGWERWHPSPPWADPGMAVCIAGAAAVVLIIVWTVRIKPRFVLAWLPALFYPLLPTTAMFIGRSGAHTSYEIVQTLRHVSEVAVIISIVFAFLLGLTMQPKTRTPWVPVGLLAFVLAGSTAVSTISFAQTWADQPSRIYFETLRTELTAHDAPLLDQPVPLEILLPLTYPHNHLAHILPDAVRDYTTEPTLIDEHGQLHDAELVAQRTTIPGTTPDCGTRIPATGSSLQLDGPLIDRSWVVRLNYFADVAGAVSLKLNSQWVEVPLEPGLNDIYVSVPGGGSNLQISPADHFGNFCVGTSQVGLLGVSR